VLSGKEKHLISGQGKEGKVEGRRSVTAWLQVLEEATTEGFVSPDGNHK
jgi:hypothetical protein